MRTHTIQVLTMLEPLYKMAASFSTISMVLCLVQVMRVDGFAAIHCRKGWSHSSQTGGCYIPTHIPMTYSLARGQCESLGASLASSKTPVENQFILGLIGQSATDYWLGGDDIDTDGKWEWLDGTAFNWTNWHPGRPFTNGSDSCLAIASTGAWFDNPSSYERPFICSVTVDLRLLGGGTADKGRVEVYRHGIWGTVCDKNWDDNDARVVCRVLGHTGGQAKSGAYFGGGDDTIWYENIGCDGTEKDFASCSNNGLASHTCNHGNDASVICGEVTETTQQGSSAGASTLHMTPTTTIITTHTTTQPVGTPVTTISEIGGQPTMQQITTVSTTTVGSKSTLVNPTPSPDMTKKATPKSSSRQAVTSTVPSTVSVRPFQLPKLENTNGTPGTTTVPAAPPSHGPLSGGTRLTFDVTSSVLWQLASIRIGHHDISNFNRTSTRVTFLTPKGNTTFVTMPINLILKDGSLVHTKYAFTYKPDPIVTRIYPLETIRSGGTRLTVDGRYLDSVADPNLNLIISTTNPQARTQRVELNSNCDKDSVTFNKMLCQTPNTTDHIREDMVDSYDLYIGLTLDGVQTYKNLTATLPQYGKLRLFSDPSLNGFDGEKIIEPWTAFLIEGRSMTRGCTKEDYIVAIGQGQCEIEDLTDNELICFPPYPPTQNPVDQDLGSKRYHLLVRIGHSRVHEIGVVRYKEDNTVLHAIIGSSVTGLVVIIGVVIVCVGVKRKANTKTQHNYGGEYEDIRSTFGHIVDSTDNRGGSGMTYQLLGINTGRSQSDDHGYLPPVEMSPGVHKAGPAGCPRNWTGNRHMATGVRSPVERPVERRLEPQYRETPTGRRGHVPVVNNGRSPIHRSHDPHRNHWDGSKLPRQAVPTRVDDRRVPRENNIPQHAAHGRRLPRDGARPGPVEGRMKQRNNYLQPSYLQLV